MDQWGCVDLPALPLQLLLRRHPDWERYPVAVVDEDRPQGKILWTNEAALRSKVFSGRSYAEGLALASELRAGVVSVEEIETAVQELLQFLHTFTPEVEPSRDEPGLFWLNATGVQQRFPSLRVWASSIVQSLRPLHLTAAVVVGYSRFGTYALARETQGVRVLSSADRERRLSDRVALHRLSLAPALRDALSSLGIEDVGGFRRLPPGGILERFGAEAHALHRLAHESGDVSFAPLPEIVPVQTRHDLEPDQHGLDVHGLLFLLKQRLAHLARSLGCQGQTIASLQLRLLFDKQPVREETVSPAAPTLDEVQLVDLLRLRLSSIQLTDEVVGFELHAEVVSATVQQKQLFRAAPRRDLDAGARALARLRAELGEQAVVCAMTRPGHLPEARYCWTPLQKIQPCQAEDVEQPRLVRRVLARPQALARPRVEPDGWFVGGLACGPIYNLFGPYVVSGGWWRREQHREYYFAETRRGDLLWIYHDRRRRQWFLHGSVL